MTATTEFLRAVAWPAVAFYALWRFRDDVSGVLVAAASKLDTVDKLKVRAFGVSFELAAGVAKDAITSPTKTAGPPGETDQSEFTRLVAEYDAISAAAMPDPRARAAKRGPIADRLGRLAVSLGKSRKSLAVGSEGERVAMATAIVLDPGSQDMLAIEAASNLVEGRFTAYRIVLALAPTLAKPNVSDAMRKRVIAVLVTIEHRAEADDDPALHGLITRTRSAITIE